VPGFADLFGLGGAGGGMFGGDPAGGLGALGDLLTPAMKQQLAARSLAAMAGAFGAAAMPSRMPIPIGAALGQAAGAMSDAQDKGLESALKLLTTQAKLAEIKSTIAGNKEMSDLAARAPSLGFTQPSTVPGQPGPVPLQTGTGDGTGGGSQPAVSSMTADATMDPVQRAFLDSIAGPESGGAYNARWRGKTFEGYDAHPGIFEPGPKGPSSAAGRYEIVKTTWDPLQEKLGLPDFSPPSQDRAAWTLAADTYKAATNRDLLSDLKAGDLSRVASALGSQWPTIGRALPAFANNLAKYGAQGGDTALPAVPDFGGMLAGNQRPGYAPAGPEIGSGGGMPAAGNIDVGRPIMDPSLPRTAEGQAAAAPMSQFSAAYANAVSKGFRGTIQDFAQQQQAAPVQVAQNGPPGIPPRGELSPQPQPGGVFAPRQQPQGGVFAPQQAPQAPQGGGVFGGQPAPPQYNQQAIDAAAKWARDYALAATRNKRAVPGWVNELGGLPLAGPKAAATAAAEQPYKIELEDRKAANSLRQALAAQGINLTPGGENIPAPGYQETTAAQKGAVARAEAEAQQSAILQREQAMARFNVNPNAIDLGGGLRSGGAFPGGAAGTAPAAAPAPTPTAPAYGGLGVTEPLPTSHGTVIPPVTTAAPIVGSPEYLKAKQSGKGGWADTEQEWAASRGAAKKAEQAAFAVADALKKFQSGAAAGELADVQAKLRAVGIDLPDRLLGNSAEAQKVVKYNFSQTISSMKGFDANPAAYQIKLAFENWANTNLQPEANLAILAQSVGLARWQEKLQQDFSEAKKYGWRDPQDFMLKWDQVPTNSLQSFVARAEQEIGPLKGAPGAPPGSTPRRSYYDPRTRRIVPQE
jgi:muramidase (phage lysozyme)